MACLIARARGLWVTTLTLKRVRLRFLESEREPQPTFYVLTALAVAILLYHFSPKVENSLNIPILIVYALVNRPYIVDLEEGRSLVVNLLELGLDVYLIDWGYPSRGDRWLTLDDYIRRCTIAVCYR